VVPMEEIDDAQLAEMEGVIGAGQSDNVDDRGTPLLYIAQSTSKAVKKNRPEYVEGLEPGKVFINLTGRHYDAENEGFLFYPCFFRVNWLEWTPQDDGGGFHGSHPRDTPLIKSAKPFTDKDGNVRRDIFVMDNGHELKLTHHYYGLLDDGWRPIIIPMSSTQLGCSQRFQALIGDQKVKTSSGKVVTKPGFWNGYRLRTVPASNDNGDWYKLTVALEGPNEDENLRALCTEFALACIRNEVQMSMPVEDGGSSDDKEVPV
jgi:hypothetical protein